ncbi:hypothetical protein BABINDRAFT_162848 [Babjeviella inositovora NRRL Y-12698]|uniref:Uncharacterized protein n=1 Tax=Babjeviella inositovora NRRL Y-12698 TaxID=984486 RepID=A0A1E3QKG0_9ASCO|nr:uncharacterized protein BABINDRAFT_162848 [Babjeviella inositovora NRRL Y-12698]ODQ78175.1 hypothetical protein BABINDRAFT_162848 [Babjeviella inositovora NRRL Y-12698]
MLSRGLMRVPLSKGLFPLGYPLRSFSIKTRLLNYRDTNLNHDSPIEFEPFKNPSNDTTIKIRKPWTIGHTTLEPNFRQGWSPMYVSPSITFISAVKKFSLVLSATIFGVLHVYNGTSLSADLVSNLIQGLAILPVPLVHFFTKDYVTRVFRIYDDSKPQTLENLTTNEKFVFEKLNWTGTNVYNELVYLDGLRLVNPKEFSRLGWVNWKDHELTSNVQRHFYIADEVGGFKMDRLWDIVEKNSGVNNGRFLNDRS